LQLTQLFLNISRPTARANYWNTFAGNIFLILFSGCILLAACFFPVDRLPLGFCVFLNLTGFPCPTCGFTRAFCAFANGNWGEGIYLCPLAFVIFVLVALVFLYNAIVIVASLFGLRILPEKILQLSSKKIVFLAVVFSLLLLANWIYRLIMGFR